MNKRDLKRFKEDLLERRLALLKDNESLNQQSVVFNPDDLADEADLASSETDQALNVSKE